MSDLFLLSDDSIIYVVCPANYKTGGTELLHQLVFQLVQMSRKAYIAYYLEDGSNANNPIPEEFNKYINNWCLIDQIEDEGKNIVVLPEVCVKRHRRFIKIQKCIWWLSVDNYLMAADKNDRINRYGFLSFLKHWLLNNYCSMKELKKIEVHLYQSYYAADFLKRNGIEQGQIHKLSDYLNDLYFEKYEKYERQNIVIYNPKKGRAFTEKIIKYDDSINWVAIEGMNNEQVLNLMRCAKVYIDFGNHPGKDRMPREAAICGCCIITGKNGSAAFYEDVKIADKYKFEAIEENIPNIVKLIKECLDKYESCINEFEPYRQRISKEKAEFIKDVNEIWR